MSQECSSFMTQILLVFITGSMLDNTCFACFHVYTIQGIMYFKCNSQEALFVGFEGFFFVWEEFVWVFLLCWVFFLLYCILKLTRTQM